MNDFYGRNDEDGKHRMFTYKNLTGHKHRFTNDVQISIGDAHSGYPVMNSSFSTNSTTLPTTPLNDWLIWHEVGHNAAETPLTVLAQLSSEQRAGAVHAGSLSRQDEPCR